MADATPIEWTDATWNPITGCTRVSEGCRNCYAEVMAARFSGPGQWGEGLARIVRDPNGKAIDHRWTGKLRFNNRALDLPLRWRKPRRIFVNSTSDLFHEDVPDEWIDKVFAVMALTPQHTFQVLTKRPERMQDYLTAHPARIIIERWADHAGKICGDGGYSDVMQNDRTALQNVWMGTSVEDQATAEARIPHLLATPAAVRFVSAEPLLGPLYLDDMCDGHKFIDALRGKWWHDSEPPHIECDKPRLDWVIVGGESGPGARPMHPDWARSIRDQCQAAGVAFFFKQWGEWTPGENVLSEITGWRANATYGPWVGGDEWVFGETDMGDPEEDWHDEPDLYRVGKKAAGRLLDGREWSEMPGVLE